MEHFFHGIQGWFNFPTLYRRMVNHAADGAVFVEVGSWYGKSTAFMAVEIVNSGKRIEFAAVDTWQGSAEHQPGAFSEDAGVKKYKDIFPLFMRNMEPLRDKYNIRTLQMPSVEAAPAFGNRSLDFVFIDAAHDYANVKADINAWWPKVKVGGWIGGHDYDPSWPGVIQAVNEFFRDRGPLETFEGSWLHRKTGT